VREKEGGRGAGLVKWLNRKKKKGTPCPKQVRAWFRVRDRVRIRVRARV
jgi:hypothetical protein